MSVLAVNSASLSKGDCELYFLIKMLWLSIAEDIFLFSIIPFFFYNFNSKFGCDKSW